MIAEDSGEGHRPGNGRQREGLLQACHQVHKRVTLFSTSDAACLQPADAVCLQMLTVKILLLQTWVRPQAILGTGMACLWRHMLHSILQVQGRIEAFRCPQQVETAGGLSWREGPLQKGGGGGGAIGLSYHRLALLDSKIQAVMSVMMRVQGRGQAVQCRGQGAETAAGSSGGRGQSKGSGAAEQGGLPGRAAGQAQAAAGSALPVAPEAQDLAWRMLKPWHPCQALLRILMTAFLAGESQQRPSIYNASHWCVKSRLDARHARKGA